MVVASLDHRLQAVIPPGWVLVFVDGCFWHGCPKPKHAPAPKTRAEFWALKLGRNYERDREVTRFLKKAGWTVIRVWECDLAAKHWPRVARRVARALEAGKIRRESRGAFAHRGTGKPRHRAAADRDRLRRCVAAQ